MKCFYDLELKEYRKLKKEFNNTIVGFRLVFITSIFLGLFVLGAICDVVEFILDGTTINEIEKWANGMDSSFNFVIIITLISYSVYQRNLKQFYDEKFSKKTKERKK